jgi:osmoprotectant transport system substrate-binding protein
MRMIRGLALGASMLALLSACTTGGGGTTSPSASASAAPPTSPSASASAEPSAPTAPISIGSDGFYESQLMAEIYAQVLEANGYTVERNLGLGARDVSAAALESGEIDLKPEYIGSGLGFYKQAGLTEEDPTGDSAETAANLASAVESIELSVLGYTPGQDTNAFVVREDTATEHSLTTISDLAEVADQLKWGLPPECATNPLCGGALNDAYGIDISTLDVTPLAACDVPIAEALNGGAIDVAELCSTQPAIAQFNFVVLEDDQATQPAENIAPLVRNDYLDQVDAEAFQALLDAASEKMTTEELTRLGVLVAVEQQEVAEVAATWLEEQGLVGG